MVKCLPAIRETQVPWVGKIPWRRKCQPTPVLLPGKSHEWRSLVGYSPWGCKESDMTEQLHFMHFSHFILYHWRRKWQPTPVFLTRESQGRGSLLGCHLWSHTESDMTEVTKHTRLSFFLPCSCITGLTCTSFIWLWPRTSTSWSHRVSTCKIRTIMFSNS